MFCLYSPDATVKFLVTQIVLPALITSRFVPVRTSIIKLPKDIYPVPLTLKFVKKPFACPPASVDLPFPNLTV